MPDIVPTPEQSEQLDALKAEALVETEAGLIAKEPDGSMVEITSDGTVREVTEVDDRPAPVEVDADPEEFKPPEVALAVDTRDSTDVYRAMDRNDEVQILDELMGRAIKSMLYSFEQKGQLLTDFTVAGVNETIRVMNERGGTQVGISEQPPIVDEFTEGEERYFRCLVFARDARFPESGRWGTAVEPVMMVTKAKGKIWDKFALTKALNKAQRNALRAFIPEDFRQTIIAMFLQQGRVEKLQPLGGGAVAELPAPIDDERAQALKIEIHDAYRELKELNPLKMPPARFNAFLTRAETDSHERMEAFRDQIRQLTDEEREVQTS